MWNFDDEKEFELIWHFEIPAAYTYGAKDRDKRERIRESAIRNFVKGPFNYKWYGFRIKVFHRELRGKERFDVGNVSTLILDAFSGEQIKKDESEYSDCALYPDDTLMYVRAIQIEGDFNEINRTEVWIFGKK